MKQRIINRKCTKCTKICNNPTWSSAILTGSNLIIDHPRYNTAFVTFINHRVQSSKADSVMTLAHEIGHSFGAYHDQDTQDCSHMVTDAGIILTERQ